MREVFEAFLTDPVRINEDVYALWLQGHNATDALSVRLLSSQNDHLPAIGDAAKMRELLWRDTVDQYRLFEKLEHYLIQPSLFRSQLLFQIPPLQQYFMIERYYSIDGNVARWLLGKKLTTAKIQKDLDEISEFAQRTLKSCRRQLENLRRVYSTMEERNFQGVVCSVISESFSLSEKLSSKYACVLFLLHGRFEVHPMHRATSFLTWHDLLFIASLVMVHWIPQRKQTLQLLRAKPTPTLESYTTTTTSSSSAPPTPQSVVLTPPTIPPPPVLLPPSLLSVSTGLVAMSNPVENAADICLRSHDTSEWPSLAFLHERLVPMSVRKTIGLDLSMNMTNCLRDLKAHLINDGDALTAYRNHVMQQLTALYDPVAMHELTVKLYLVVHGLLTIGAGLSQPKELKDLLGNLVTMVIRVLHDCGIQHMQLNDVFAALIDSLAKLDVWYLHGEETRSALLASWERFLSVSRVIVSGMETRRSTSAAALPVAPPLPPMPCDDVTLSEDATSSASEASSDRPVVTRKRRKKTATKKPKELATETLKSTYYQRRNEIKSLEEQVRHLQQTLEAVTTNLPSRQSQEKQSLRDAALRTALFGKHIEHNHLVVAGAQGMLSSYIHSTGESNGSIPLHTVIQLPKDRAQRDHTLRAMRDAKLTAALRFMAERTRSVDLRRVHSHHEEFDLAHGALGDVGFQVSHFGQGHSLRQVYDAFLFFVTNQEITVSERLGALTVRESDDVNVIEDDGHGEENDHEFTVGQTRLLTSLAEGLEIESNTAVFATFVDGGSSPGDAYGLITADTVDNDELYPWRVDTCGREEVTAAVLLTELPRFPHERHQGPLVAMVRWTHTCFRPPSFPLTARADAAARAGLNGWCHVLPRAMRERLEVQVPDHEIEPKVV